MLESVTGGDLNTSDYKLPKFSSKEFPASKVNFIIMLSRDLLHGILSYLFLQHLSVLVVFIRVCEARWPEEKNSPVFLTFCGMPLVCSLELGLATSK